MEILGVQMKIKEEDFSLEGFERHIESFFKKTSNGDFIIFPEEAGVLPIFGSKNGRTMMEATMKTINECSEKGNEVTIQDLFRRNTRKIESIFSLLSSKYSVYSLICGNFLYDDAVGVVNRSIVFDKAGKQIFHQDKINLTREETELGIAPGVPDKVDYFVIDGVNFAVAISLDAFVPSYVARMTNSDVIIQPDANPNVWNGFLENGRWQAEEWMDSAYYIAQRVDRVKYAINPMLTGDFYEINFQGQASICKKAEGTDSRMGYVGNDLSTGFHEIFEVKGYRKDERIERKEVLGKTLDFGEGMLSVSL